MASGHPVEALPAGHRFEVAPGETVMAGAERAGLIWPTVCHGHLRCARCRMVIEDGAEHASTMAPDEAATLRRFRGSHGVATERLACQVETNGPMVVRRRGVVIRGQEGTG